MDVASGLAAFLQEWERAGRLYGAAEVQLEQTGIHRETADEAFLVPLIAKAREKLGDDAFAAAVESGRALSYHAATAEARAWLQQRA